jgi:hypothetical protein
MGLDRGPARGCLGGVGEAHGRRGEVDGVGGSTGAGRFLGATLWAFPRFALLVTFSFFFLDRKRTPAGGTRRSRVSPEWAPLGRSRGGHDRPHGRPPRGASGAREVRSLETPAR